MLLYHLQEFKKAAMIPANLWSQSTGLFLNLIPKENNPVGRILSAQNEILERSTRIFSKPEFNISEVICNIKDSDTLCSVKESVEFQFPFCDLRFFKRYYKDKRVGKDDPHILVVAPLSGHFSTLLKDTVKTLLKDHNVWITDWHDAKTVPLSKGEFGLHTYVDYLIKMIAKFKGNVHLLAVCQPVVPVLMAATYLSMINSPYQPKSMILMGGPIDTRINPGKVNQFAVEHSLEWFKNNIIDTIPLYYPGSGRKVCPGFIMLSGFMSLNIDRHSDASFQLFLDLIQGDEESVEARTRFYDEYRSVMDIPAEYFLQSIETVFQNFSLPKGQMYYKGKYLTTHSIKKTALLTIEGEKDDISPPGQTYVAHELCKNIPLHLKEHYLQKGVGHYGIFNGRKWRENIKPVITEFIKKVEKDI